MKVKIYFDELTELKKEEITTMVKSDIISDTDLMENLEQIAKENGVEVEVLVDEEAGDRVNTNWQGEATF